MAEYTALSDGAEKALRRFLVLRDRLVTLNLQAATLAGVAKLAAARLPHLAAADAATQAERQRVVARRDSARRLHAGLAAGSHRVMRRLVKARGAAGLDRRDP